MLPRYKSLVNENYYCWGRWSWIAFIRVLSFESHDITLIDDNDVSLKDGENYLDIKVISGDHLQFILNQAKVKFWLIRCGHL